MKDVLQALRSGWWLVTCTALLAVAVAGAVSWTVTPLYSSSTKLFVSTSATPDTSAAYQGNLFSQQRVTSYAELLAGVELAGRVVDDLGLPLTAVEVTEKITATPVPDTVILTVTVTDASPSRARDIAASLGRQFGDLVTELETPGGTGASAVKVTTVEEPETSTVPVSPDVPRNLTLAAVLGLVVGLGLALLRTRLDNTVRTNDEVLQLTGSGVIGTVLEDPRLTEEHLVTDLDQHSPTAEAYRSIRTNLQFLNVDAPPRVIVVTSSVPGEGKSTLVVNLATVLAQSGSRVALIEGDLRRPRVTRYMGLIGGAGLTNVLGGTASLREVVQPWGNGRLAVLAAGPMPPNPSEMLGSGHMWALLNELRADNDFVLIDAPPLLPVTDAAVLTALSDGCLIVTRFGRTRREELAEAASSLARIDAKLLGVVFNRVPQSTGPAGGYGYGYEADPGREAAGHAVARSNRTIRRGANRRSPADRRPSARRPVG